MSEEAPAPRARVTGTLIALVLLVGLLSWLGHQPPTPGPASDAARFSAHRAVALLRTLTPTATPHPIGSVENRAVRARILTALRERGLRPEVHRAFACQGATRRRCGVVHNIIARLPGGTSGRHVVLSAHYDSVPAGPGSSDDMASVAALIDMTTTLRDAPRRNPITLLLTDGEEVGLLGAHALRHHPLSRDAAFIINLEARGTSGRSFLFETGAASGWTASHAIAALSRPSMNSLAPFVYARLPNATDLTVHRAHRHEGVNLGYFRGVAHYHTPLDDLAHLDLRTLQHQGQNALELAQHMAQIDLSPDQDARNQRLVYADLLGRVVLRWPSGASPWLAALAIVLLLGSAITACRRSDLSLRVVVSAAGWSLALALVASLASVAVDLGTRAVSGHPLPWRGMWLAGVALHALLGVAAGVWCRPRDPLAWWIGAWLPLAALGLATGITAPPISFLFIIPALLGALGAFVALHTSSREAPDPTLETPHDAADPGATLDAPTRAALLLAWSAAALMLLPVVWTLLDALELFTGVIVTLPFAWLAIPLAALFPRPTSATRTRRTAATLAIATLCAAAVALGPHHSAARPETLNVTALQHEGASPTGTRATDRTTYLFSQPPLGLSAARPPAPAGLESAQVLRSVPAPAHLITYSRTVRAVKASAVVAARPPEAVIVHTSGQTPAQRAQQVITVRTHARGLRITGEGATVALLDGTGATPPGAAGVDLHGALLYTEPDGPDALRTVRLRITWSTRTARPLTIDAFHDWRHVPPAPGASASIPAPSRPRGHVPVHTGDVLIITSTHTLTPRGTP